MNKAKQPSILHQEDAGKLILRISTGGLMLFHGIHKLIHGHDYISFLLKNNHFPEWIFYGVPIGEVVAPLLLIAGIRSRLAALLIAFTMFMSIYLHYGLKAFTLDQYGGLMCQLNLLFLFASLTIFFAGGGRYSFSHASKWD